MSLVSFHSAIENHLASISYGEKPVELYEPIRYLMALGGKRIRPLLTVLAAECFTDNWQRAVAPGCGVEVFHNFTLMHDDIMDKAPLRRGKPTVHAKWNENIGILSGDVMLVCAYQQMLAVPDAHLRRAIEKFNKVAAEVCEGQQMDMNFETLATVTKPEYIEMIRLKTAVLLGFALELGGLVGGANEESLSLLKRIGDAIGTGFQLKDDILDVYGDPAKFGKQIGGDILANKKTFLLLDALESAEGQDAVALQNWLVGTHSPEAKIAGVTQLYDQLGVRERAEAEMIRYFEEGFSCLEALPVSPEKKKHLKEVFEALAQRDK